MTRHQHQSRIVFGLPLGLTSGTLAVAHALNSVTPAAVELALLGAAHAAATPGPDKKTRACVCFSTLRDVYKAVASAWTAYGG